MLNDLNKVDASNTQEKIKRLDDLGRFHFILGNFSDSTIYYERALGICELVDEENKDQEMIAKLWLNIINNYIIQRKYSCASAIVKKVDIFGPPKKDSKRPSKHGKMKDPQLLIRLVNSIGIYYFKLGNYKMANMYLSRVLKH